MKIRSLFLVTIFALFSASAFAKSSKPVITPATKESIEEAQIQPSDFQKLFVEAEKNFQTAKAWKKIKCQPKSGFLCTKHECVKRTTTASLTLDKAKGTITRCEQDNCDTYKAEFKQTGIFFNIQTEGPIGSLIRVFGDSRYKEITTVGLDAYIDNGNCEVLTE